MRAGELSRGLRGRRRAGRARVVSRGALRRIMHRLRGWTDLAGLQRLGLRVGDDVFVGPDCHLDPAFCHLISIGHGSTLSVAVIVLAHDASTRRAVGYTRLAPVVIGERVFIGAGAVILPGARIGDDAIVGAGSVVRGEVQAGAVVVGNPARQIDDQQRYVRRHREALTRRPTWPLEGWTTGTGISPERQELMRRALRDGEGYVR